MIVADSDVLIDALRGREPSRSRIDDELGAGTLVTTVVSAFELRSGVTSDQALRAIETLLAPLPVLPLDADAESIPKLVETGVTSFLRQRPARCGRTE